MSVWSNIQGSVKIHKKDNVSIKKIIENVFTDEFCLNIDTKTLDDHYIHHINCNICIDGDDFIKHHKEFFDVLKPMKGGMDLTCELRFLS
jgi:hypothetical protein